MSTTSRVTAKQVADWLDWRAQELDDQQLNAVLSGAGIRSVVPEVLADPDLVAEANAAAREMTRQLVVGALPPHAPPAPPAPPAVLVSVVRTWARRGIDLRMLMRGVRHAQANFWRWWMDDVASRIDDPDLRRAVLQQSWERVSAWHEAQIEMLEEIYTEERERWLRGAHARRGELVRSLLSGDSIGTEEATLGLGHDLRRTQTAFVLWVEGDVPEVEALAVLEETARELATAFSAARVLTIPAGSRALWAWIATDGEPAAEAWEGAATVLLPTGSHAAAGRPAPDVSGFRTSHQDAQLARRLTALGHLPDHLSRFTDVEVACIMAGEPEAMRRFVLHELGPLAARDDNAARLRETARVYLECGGNAREAADRLNMHKNTVHYRLARIEELLGRPIIERRLELEVALMLAHKLGNRVLRPVE
jgi:hypothetical protein